MSKTVSLNETRILPKWQDIKTAPKDGTRLIGWVPNLGVQVIEWVTTDVSSHWSIHGPWLAMFDPSHWMPMPIDPLPRTAETAPKDGTLILAEFEGLGVTVANWSSPAAGCVAQWNHGWWLQGGDPIRWDRLPSCPLRCST